MRDVYGTLPQELYNDKKNTGYHGSGKFPLRRDSARINVASSNGAVSPPMFASVSIYLRGTQSVMIARPAN